MCASLESPTQDLEPEEGKGQAEVGRLAGRDSRFFSVFFAIGSVSAVFWTGAFLLSRGFAAGLAIFVRFTVEVEADAFFSDVSSVFFSAEPFATVFCAATSF